MNQILYSKNAQKTKVVVLILVIVLLLLVLGFFTLGFMHGKSDKIAKGIVVNSVDVGNMTVEEAKVYFNKQQIALDRKTYLLSYKNREVEISGDAIDLEYANDCLQSAYEYGKTGNIFENSLIVLKSLFQTPLHEFNSEVTLNESVLKEKLDVLLEEEKATAVDDLYELSKDKILVTKGHDGVTAKLDSVKSIILENALTPQTDIKVIVETTTQLANRIDFNELYNEVYVERKNASYTAKEDGEAEFVREIIGISFNKEAAENDYLNLADDEVLEIDLIEEAPEITTANLDNVLFADVLATYKTTYNASNVDRSTNLEVAARNINDTILLPGDEFSYNKEVGQRTYANGFKDAHIFAGGKVVDGLGGGICQISSTLYNAILKIDGIEIVERKNHMLYPEYVEPSLDATVVWGSIDFRFKNTRETPIKIKATVKNGVATTTIYGKKSENEPIIELESVIEKTIPYTTVTEYDNTLEEGKSVVTQTPVNGYVSKAYKILKDSNGKEISRTLISSDTYKQTSKIVTVGTKKVEKPIEPEISVDNNGNQSSNNSSTENNNAATNPDSEWPTGWDSPENPYYTGNY